jgi:hypothetical protein
MGSDHACDAIVVSRQRPTISGTLELRLQWTKEGDEIAPVGR